MKARSILRVRHEVKLRTLTVRDVTRLTPRMARITLHGKELEDFTSQAPDDHIKLFFDTASGETEKRDYTPRKFDSAGKMLTIDIALHDTGIATHWAASAKAGDTITIGGPKASMIVPTDFDWWILVGDESALPSISRRLEEMPAEAKVLSVITIASPEEEQKFSTRAKHQVIWLHRPLEEAHDPAPVLAALATIPKPAGDGYVWIGSETRVARAAKDYFLRQWQQPAEWVKARGYWVQGQAGKNEKLD